MNKLRTISLTTIFVCIILLIITCSDSPTNPNEQKIEFVSHQVPGCQNSSSLSKVSYYDSLFNYSFIDTLKINLGVWGNCGPDSNRFETTYRLNQDSIFISVQDTAIDMYWCECDYIVNISFTGLQEDKYYVNCTFPEDSLKWNTLQYKEIVIRE